MIRGPVKVLIIFLSAALLGVSLWGNVLLRQEFNPVWFLPAESYLAQWHQHNSRLFPSQGEQVTVFLAGLDLPNELAKLDMVHEKLKEQEDIIAPRSVDSWYLDFKAYVNKNFDADLPEVEMEVEDFEARLTQFLFSPTGSKHRFVINFNSSLECGLPASKMEVISTFSKLNILIQPNLSCPLSHSPTT